MTVYSTLATGKRSTLMATWPGDRCRNTVKVTTVDDDAVARELSNTLTSLSEASWYSAAWLLTWPQVRAFRDNVVELYRQQGSTPEPGFVALELDRLPHGSADASQELEHLVADDVNALWGRLTDKQRRRVADEIQAETDQIELAFERRDDSGPGTPERALQMFEISDARQFGAGHHAAADNASLWLSRYLGTGDDRWLWAGRDVIVRLLQLAAAAQAAGAQLAITHGDPLETRVRFGGAGQEGMQVWRFRATRETDRRRPGARAKGPQIRVERSFGGLWREVLGEVGPRDGDGLAALVGDWVHEVPMPR